MNRCPMNRPRPEQIAPPSFVPPDAVRADTYPDMMDVLRSRSFEIDRTWGDTAVFTGGSLFLLEGTEHVSRRRVINRLARPAALEWHRSQVLTLMEQTLAGVAAKPDADGVCRAELVALLRRVFASFAGAIIGCHDALTPQGGDALLDIFKRIEGGYRAKYTTDPAARRAALDAAGEARRDFEARFWDQAMAAWDDRLRRVAAGELTEDELPHDFAGLVASRAHPDWDNRDSAVNDALMILLGAIDTSTGHIIRELDHLHDWLEVNPQDATRLSDRTFLTGVGTETLRLHSAFETKERWAVEDITLPSGKQVKKDHCVYGVYIAANIDPEVWGDDADTFNPYRTPPPAVAPYGASFGAGIRQCLGLRIVLGEGDSGERSSHLDVLRMLLEAGVEPDPDRPRVYFDNETGHIQAFPVVFSKLGRSLAAR